MYRNRYNYHYRKIIEANQQARNQPIVPPVAAPADSTCDVQTMKLIRSTWLRAIGKQTPREVFAELNQDLIDLKKEEIKAEPGNTASGGGVLNAAITRAWDECEDKEKYIEMAEGSDIERSASICYVSFIHWINCYPTRTRKYLPYLLQTAARDILLRKVVGDAAIKILIAWRLPDGNISSSMYVFPFLHCHLRR